MKKILQKLLFGRPVKGQPLHSTGVITTVPFNMSYEGWQYAIEQFGHDFLINFLNKKSC